MSSSNWCMKACGVLLLWAAAAVPLPAQTNAVTATAPVFTTPHTFDGTDGGSGGTLFQGADGNLYGTTAVGGDNNNPDCEEFDGCGTVFKITLSGTLTSLHSFDYTDGYGPNAVVQATGGEFYGTIFGGGPDCAYFSE